MENNLVSDGRVGSFHRCVNKKLIGSREIAPLRNSNGGLVYSIKWKWKPRQRTIKWSREGFDECVRHLATWANYCSDVCKQPLD